MDLHPRTLQRNIWSGLISATDQEIKDGMDFYPGAYGLCKLLSSVFNVSVERVAGIYAALSPMNGWDTNVANIVDILRYRKQWIDAGGPFFNDSMSQWPSWFPLPKVNTPHPNRDKALLIACGKDPLSVLSGKKVRAFYSAISNPSDLSSIPVDRHLICLALGQKLSKNELSRAASSPALYSKVEAAYTDLGRREGLGNRIASISWFVQRRIPPGQAPLPHPESPFCCGAAMWSYGRTPRRFLCPTCKKLQTIKLPKYVPRLSEVQYDIPIPLDRVSIGKNNRPLLYLGKGQPYTTSSGCQYLARYVVMYLTGEVLRKDEEVHHIDGNRLNCLRDNLKVMLKEEHGRHHARYMLLYILRDKLTGRFLPSQVPSYSDQLANLTDQYSDVSF